MYELRLRWFLAINLEDEDVRLGSLTAERF